MIPVASELSLRQDQVLLILRVESESIMKMNKVILIFLTVLATISSIYGNEDIQCYKERAFNICKQNNTIIHVNETTSDSPALFIKNYESIAPYAFQDLSIEELSLSPGNDPLKLHSNSLEGLRKVSLLAIGNATLSLEENVFKPLSSLVELYIFWSRIIGLKKGAFAGLSKLEYLFLPENDVSTINADTFHGLGSQLHVIRLEGNRISLLEPHSFENFGNVLILNLSENQLTDIEPGVFHGLHSLKDLYLKNNQLTIVRRNYFNCLKRLEVLDLSYNKINVIEAEAFDGLSLKYLELKYNQLRVISIGIFRGASIEKLDLFQNTTVNVEDNAFSNSRIKVIYFNMTYSIDKQIWGLPQSTQLHYYSNDDTSD